MSQSPQSSLTTLPYDFIPLSAFVYQPDWVDQISQDHPFQDGLSGSFTITITAQTPILCGAGKQDDNSTDKDITFFKTPDDRYAIPGSTLRGMVRNVIEIAAFGRMSFVDQNRRFGIREISGTKQLNQTAQRIYINRLKEPKTGFLTVKDNTWFITPCFCAYLPITEIQKIVDEKEILIKKENVNDRYNSFLKLHKTTNAIFKIKECQNNHDKFITVQEDSHDARDGHQGVIVLTGKASEPFKKDRTVNKKDKKRDFFFYSERKSDRFTIPSKIVTGFRDIHEVGETEKTWNPNWKYWHQKLRENSNTKIPIFYITGQSNEVESFGLAMMFKLAHEKTVGEILNNTHCAGQEQSDHCKNSVIDLATAIFGTVRKTGDDAEGDQPFAGFKGRVSIGPAIAPQSAEPMASIIRAVLLAPKPQFYPAYIRQDQINSPFYASYTPIPGPDPLIAAPELAGWKRYPATKRHHQNPPLPSEKNGKTNDNVVNDLLPLPCGTMFTGRIRFHNLKPVELGALLWALEWDGDEGLVHRIGMGKPLGLGNIAITVAWDKNAVTMNDPTQQTPDKAALRACFKSALESAYAQKAHAQKAAPGKASAWENSRQIQTLRAFAKPDGAPRHYPDPKAYVQARNNLWKFPPRAAGDAQADTTIFPREPRVPTTPMPRQNSTAKAATQTTAAPRPLVVGDRVIDKETGETGWIEAIEGNQATVDFEGTRYKILLTWLRRT